MNLNFNFGTEFTFCRLASQVLAKKKVSCPVIIMNQLSRDLIFEKMASEVSWVFLLFFFTV